MPRDFTLQTYRELVEAGTDAGYAFLTVRDYLAGVDLPDRFVILRHDVDRKPENAAAMARLEADASVPSTYYFRTVARTFRPSLIREIEGLGHEVGYHYEDLDRRDGDLEAAHESFRSNLAALRSVCAVTTVCMHGNPLTPHDNREMWTRAGTPSFESYGLLGEAYLSMDFDDVAYFSDTGRTWRDGPLKIKDHTMGEGQKAVQAETTRDLIDILEAGRLPRLCLLSHPNRWTDSYPELVAERAKDSAINLVKHGLNLRP